MNTSHKYFNKPKICFLLANIAGAIKYFKQESFKIS